MKQLIQNFKSGHLSLMEAPVPNPGENDLLLKTLNSVVSVGTEKNINAFAKSSLLAKAKSRPDLLKQLLNKAAREGVFGAFSGAMRRLDELLPLGYSSCGTVIKGGAKVTGFRTGERIAVFGTRYASHAEYTASPQENVVKVPDNVDSESAAFTSLGAIAINGVRNTQLKEKADVAVIGLGIIGFITALVLKAYGHNVAVFDINHGRVEKARKLGITKSFDNSNSGAEEAALAVTNHKGFDSVIITASTKSSQPIDLAAKISRFRGRIVLVGVVGLDLSRRSFYEKELEFVVSKDAGPKPDTSGEDSRKNYVLPDKEWTQGGNMEEFLSLLSEKKLDVRPLITHRIDFDDILNSYKEILSGTTGTDYLGTVIKYKGESEESNLLHLEKNKQPKRANSQDKVNIAVIGTGQFARNIFLPLLFKNNKLNLRAVSSEKGLSARQTGQKYNAEYVTTDYKEILKDKCTDSVFIMTRHDKHASMVIDALNAGKNIYVEKPLCLTRNELKEVAENYRRKSSGEKAPFIMVGFNRRFSSLAKEAKEFLSESGNSPKVITIRANVGYILRDHWSQDMNIGGGRIIGEVCHYIDLVNYFTDSFPISVYASKMAGSENKDDVLINLEYSDGSVANICYSASGTKAYPRERIEVFSAGSVCVIDDFMMTEYARSGSRKKKRLLTRDMGYKAEIDAFMDVVSLGTEPPVDFNSYLRTTLASFSIIESIDRRAKIDIDYSDYLMR